MIKVSDEALPLRPFASHVGSKGLEMVGSIHIKYYQLHYVQLKVVENILVLSSPLT